MDNCPAVTFKDGKLVVDEVSLAHQARIFVGCKVYLPKKPDTERAQGVVEAIHADGLVVKWEKVGLAEERKYMTSELNLLKTLVIEQPPTEKNVSSLSWAKLRFLSLCSWSALCPLVTHSTVCQLRGLQTGWT
jgi:hypothetical protein